MVERMITKTYASLHCETIMGAPQIDWPASKLTFSSASKTR